MSKQVPQFTRITCFAVAALLIATALGAQDINLTKPGTAQVLRGSTASQAGAWLEQAAVGEGDNQKDLIIGSPAWSNDTGRISILYKGPVHTGTANLDSVADSVINGIVAGARFGAASAAGFVFNNPAVSTTAQRDLIVAAPGSPSDAGRVYVFAGPIRRGTYDASMARFVISGAAGERFGQVVAAADLNDDGFREVIVGAPGSNHVYVFDLTGRSPGAVAAASADMVIDADAALVGHGLGEVIEAGGDVTGDGVYDLALGVPRAYESRGAVLVIRGHGRSESWQFPGAVSAAGASSLVITGAQPGDRAGQALMFRDIVYADGGVRDLLIGAPGADGPSNARTDSGEVYVLWGGALAPGCDVHAVVSPCMRGLTAPDVVVYGAAPGLRTGEMLAGGDITRDDPDDIVLTAPGGPNGVELYVVYGTRLRSTYGAVIDLASSGEFGRRIIGPGIESVVVFEATGEGANDIIAGVPAGDGGNGLVYVSISPKVAVSTRSIVLAVVQCGTGSTALEVRNPSVIPLPWEVRTNTPWLQVVPRTGSSVLGAPITARVVAASAGLAPGTYVGSFDVASTTRHVAMFIRVSVTLSVEAASPWMRNAHTDFTGDGCGDAAVFQPTTGTWHIPGGADIQLGAVGDVPVAGDYDGDRIADAAVYRRSNSTWYFESSTIVWGEVGDVPVPADYDGNGTFDVAVYRPSSGTWLIRGQSPIAWGTPGDMPVPADYDGDGRADIAVFARGTGDWRIRTQSTVNWGTAGDLPVPADYDGDGRADIAVYRRASGTWFVRGQFSIRWGTAPDVPAPIDTNRDGRAELAVYRRASGAWHIHDVGTGVTSTVQAGVSGDVPAVGPWPLLAAAPMDMNPDGRSEIAVWRPGSGTWFVKQSHSEYTTYFSLAWGAGRLNDVPIAKDFDGDRISDIAVWRPGTGTWYVLTSGDRYTGRITMQWGSGSQGDVPVPADYDGDQRADIAVWRPGTGMWFVKTSSTNYISGFNIAWGSGAVGDMPVAGDYDGDAKADLAVWRPGTGTWFVLTSTSNYRTFTTIEWGSGAAGDLPAPGDYDGDGRIDAAVYRQTTATWHIRASGGNMLAKQWGTAGDVPIVGDFDGDGQADLTVWRPANGMWYVSTSSSRFGSAFNVSWGSGAMEDVPIGAVR